jgi:Tol biopolymer transport system component/predicted Ser/Thr protein kinase
MQFSHEQWARIKELFEAARQLPTGERMKFLSDKCPTDSISRTEVERLLTAAEKSNGPLDSPPFQIPIRRPHDRAVPESISRYRIIEKLGQGGMGVVYRGQDEALKRQVAIKVLPPEEMADPERKRRLVREAQAASALNHPNIVTVYDVGTDQGADFIAMEYVSGATLGKRIGRKGLDLATCLRYAIQIADALAAAHAAGIMHRDLKPANIMVTDKDLIKILDFGLAKPIRLPGRNSGETSTGSYQGVIAGTAAYMSPEQAEGKTLDERSDIFSFGSVLYEMLTGRRAFEGQSDMSTLSSVLTKEPPPLSEIKASLPREIQRLIAMCLRKDPTRRLQHMDDVKLAVETLQEEIESGDLFQPPVPLERRRGKPVAFALVLLLAVALASSPWWWARIGRPPPVEEPVLTQLTADAGLSAYPAISRDGRLLAYASDRAGADNLDIWMQHVSGGAPIRVTKDEADDYDPDFSPDGSKIAFRSDMDGGGIYVVSSLGGEAQVIAPRGRNARFSPDGKWLLYWEGAQGAWLIPNASKIYVIPASGGAARQIRPEFAAAQYPIWIDDGKQVLFLGRLDPNAKIAQTVDWWVAPLEGGQATKTGARDLLNTQNLKPPLGQDYIIPGAWEPRYHRVVFSAALGDSTNLWEVSLSTGSGKATGPARRRTFGSGSELQVSLSEEPVGGRRMSYSTLALNVAIWKVGLDSNNGEVKGNLEAVTHALSFDSYPSVSDDGTKLAFRSSRSGKWIVRTRDLVAGKDSVLAESTFIRLHPKISRDGKKVIYWDQIGRRRLLYSIDFRGGAAQQLCEGCGPPTDVSPDGLKILFEPLNPPEDVMMLDTVSGQKINMVHASLHPDYILYGGRFSPDSRWIAFHAAVDQSANRRIFLTPVRDGRCGGEAEWISVTDGTQVERDACWSPNGNLLYFLSDRDGFRCIWAQGLNPATKHPAGPPFAIQHFHYASRSLKWMGNHAGIIGMSVASDKLALAFGELKGNLWLSELPPQP